MNNDPDSPTLLTQAKLIMLGSFSVGIQSDRKIVENSARLGLRVGCGEGMRRARWLAPWRDSVVKPAMYHCISRVVDRRFVFGDDEREKFRVFMRMQENFSGCRVLSYCVMSNHFHLLLEGKRSTEPHYPTAFV